MGKESNRPSKPKSIAIPIEPLNMADTITLLRGIAPDTPMTEKNVTRLIKAYGIKQKAYGGKIKKKMMGGMVKKKMMAGGGGLKDVPSGNTGLGKLPTPVRNKMGFKASGGKIKKTYAMGGGMRKANYK